MHTEQTHASDRNEAGREAYELSPQQRHVWGFQQLRAVHNAQLTLLLNEAVDEAALNEALRAVWQRHEALRTIFPRVVGRKVPLQTLTHLPAPSWHSHDLRPLSAQEQHTHVAQLAQAHRQTPFDLEQGPLLRGLLLHLDTHTQVLVLTLPALCVDRRSLRNLAAELAVLYAQGASELAAQAPLQYADYAQWQHDLLGSEEGPAQAARRFWSQQIEAVRGSVSVGLGRGTGERGVFSPAVLAVDLEAGLLAGVEALAQPLEMSCGVVLETVWALLLSRWTGSTSVTLGHGCEGRCYPELERGLGLFSKTLPLPLQVELSSPLRPLLYKVDIAVRDAAGWEKFYNPQSGGLEEAFAYGFEYEDWSDRGVSSGLSILDVHAYSCAFLVGLGCRRSRSGVRLEWGYDAHRYSEAEIGELASCYGALLRSALESPHAPVGSLNLLSASEREQVLVEWNATAVEYAGERCVHELFEDHVERTPQAVAVVYEEEQLTYRELNARANQLAHCLQSLGVGPDALVGLCVERSVDQIVGLLGILKAGGAYVPLDPALPQERLTWMLHDSGAKVLVTQEAWVGVADASGVCVCLDRDAHQISRHSEHNPTREVQAHHLVYVIYTSGSTGRPKGVGVEHRQLLNYVLGVSERLGLQAAARYASVSTLSADLGNTMVFPSLCVGGCLHLISSERAMDGRAFGEYMSSHGIDYLKIVPSHLRALLGEAEELRQRLPSSVLVLGGEASSWELVGKIRESCAGLRVFNHYGPTETTVGVLTYALEGAVGAEGVGAAGVGSLTVPVGRPLPNTRVYVLNGYLQPVPVGVCGELYIGGAGVCRGYLKRADLTAEKFVKDPFSDEPGARLYRTGDLGRYLSDGNIEFVGRCDEQVKMRGFRIELGEIETVLSEHPGIREAVVVAREEAVGEKRLVGYVVGHAGSVSVSELRAYLGEKLPEYMIPSAWVVMERLPLTANGKVDRKALPAPGSAGQDEGDVGARTPVEEGLAEIWREVLQLEQVGVHTSFFELGGHSLLGTQVISRIRNTFAVELPLRALFEAPTIAGLAQRIGASGGEAGYGAPALVRVSREGRLPLSFAQQRLWFIDQLEPQSSLYNVPMALRLTGSLDVGALQQSLQEIVGRHEALRTTFAVVEGEPFQVIHEGVEVTLPVVDLSSLEGEEREAQSGRRITEEAQRPFDLLQGPLLRAGLLKLGAEEHVLLLTLHHIASDAWSKGVLRRELSSLYNAFRQGHPSPLPDLPIQYADYATWQRNWLQAEPLQRQIAYWKAQLAAAPPVLNLPTDRPAPRVRRYSGERQRLLMAREPSLRLRELGRQEQATQFMIFLALLDVVLYRYTGQTDLVVGTDIANRNHADTERLIGFFLNHLVLRTDVSGNPTFRELVQRVREVCLGAYAHQDLPFDTLVEVLRPQRSTSHTPVFQVLFVMNAPVPNFTFDASLRVSSMSAGVATSKYDLGVFVSESALGLSTSWVYQTELFDAETIRGMASDLEALVGCVASAPDTPLAELEVLLLNLARQRLIWECAARRTRPHAADEPIVQTEQTYGSDRDEAGREAYELSPQQRHVWRLQQQRAVHNAQLTLHLHEAVDEAALNEALRAVWQRHEALRTIFPRVVGRKVPLQTLTHLPAPSWHSHDLRPLSAQEQHTHVAQLAQAHRQTPFDLEQGPLLRGLLLHLDTHTQVLVLTLPALCVDRRSLRNLAAELAVLYAQGASELAAQAPLQYADYAQWQHDLLGSEEGPAQAARRFWSQQIEAARGSASVGLGRGLAERAVFSPARLAQDLEAGLLAGVEALAQPLEMSCGVVLETVWALLLSRWTGSTSVTLGHGCEGRCYPELERGLGLFGKTLPLPLQVELSSPLRPLLYKVDIAVRDAAGWEEYYNPQSGGLEEELGTGFAYEDWSERTEPTPFSILALHADSSRFALGLGCRRSRSGVRLEWGYDAHRYSEAEIGELASCYGALLRSALESPHAPVGSLNLLSASEREQVLVEWNATAVEYAGERCVHELFEDHVERTPQAVAVVYEEEQLTYRELNARANQLAHCLQSLGVGPDALVGLCVERSVDQIVGLLGILKAGGAYVPLDPALPQERLTWMLHDSGAKVLVTQEAWVGVADASGVCVCLDRDAHQISRHSEHNPTREVQAHHLVYVIYTSGSTGRPKGVGVEHRQLLNYVLGVSERLGLQAAARYASVSTLSADLGNTMVFPSLCVGGCLHLISSERAMDGRAFGEYMSSHGIDYLKIVPSHLRALLGEAEELRQRLPSSVLVLGGEASSWELVGKIRESCAGLRVFNHYGPTETTVGVLTYALEGAVGAEGVGAAGVGSLTVPVGRPLPNTRVYVLNGYLQPVPVGVCGELYIGGAGVCRGYLKRADLTAEKFVKDPFSDEPGARLYRTGDLGRYLSDGNIEFVGRCDEQVKMRGFRIELGEIETVLSEHPGIREAVVVAREEAVGEKRLVGYVVGHAGSVSVSELRAYLGEKLPEYMIPSAWVVMERLPLTANGKVDRKALPAPGSAGQDEGDVGARTPVEEGLAEIWREVLQLEQVGVHTSFFELGGHSLLGTQVISRIRNTFAVELPLRALFEAPTIAGLAQRIGASGGEAGYGAPALVRVSREGRLPLSFAQQRLWFIDQLEPQSSLYNIPMALRLRGPLNEPALESSLNELLRRHEPLRTVFAVSDAEPFQVIEEFIARTLRVTDLSSLEAQERAQEARRLIQEEAQRPFDLCAGPVFRFSLLRLQEEEHVLLLTLHHIVSDAWSRGVLTRELSTLYNAFCTGAVSPLPALPIQYADYAAWQREWLQADQLQRQLSYWKQCLEGVPTLLELPTDRPRPPLQTFRGARVRREFSAGLTAGLKALCQREGTTLFMTLLAAFQTLLYRYSGQDDLVVGTPIANRTHSEVEGLIGFFVNTLVLRADLSGDPSFVALLGRVRESTLGAYAHQDLPFEKLVEELQPQRSLSHSAVFQVLFSLANAAGGVLGLAGLEIERVGSEGVSAKFDLSLVLSERRGKLMGVLEYNTDLFDADRMERMLGHLQVLLEGIVADPQQKVSRLPLLTEPEREQLVVEWNDTAVEYPRDRCIHELFEEQVQRTPDVVAVEFEDQRLTYTELNAHADHLAWVLRSQGVGPESRIGLCTARSVEMMVGVLGILKAGAAYMPIDPSTPAERVAYMCRDAGVCVVLTYGDVRDALREADVPRLSLEDNAAFSVTAPLAEVPAYEASSLLTDNLATGVVPQDATYVIYTSGSTGRPKGVVMSHGALVNLMCWQREAMPTPSRTLQFTSIGFDASFQEIFSTWLGGGTLVLVSEEQRRDFSGLLGLMERWGIERLFVPFAVLQHLAVVRARGGMSPNGLREVITAGEALQITVEIAAWFGDEGGPRLYNQYGPTEAHVVSGYALEGPVSQWASLPPIGRAISNTQLYVLDARLCPTPVGVSGELYIGGVCLARGYLNRADLTGEKFVPDPFSHEPGSRLYRTGDLASYLPDGNIEFVGRCDEQVKMRGFRIELGEIETVLSEHPGIREAVVVAREEAVGEKRLVGYVVGHAGSVSVSELRAYLGEKLPEYMIPSAWVVMERLPLTANGKVDRKALPAPGSAGQDEGDVGARTPVEEGLAEIWREVLQLEQVGVHTSFFELGGHSLLGTQVISRIRNTFAVELPLRALFEAPTIAGLAQRIGASGGEAGYGAPALVRVSREGRLPLSFAQQRLWFIDQLEPQSSLYNVPMALRLTGSLDVGALQQSLQEIVGRHEALRTTFAVVEGEPFQVIHEPSDVSLPVVDLSFLSDAEREREARRLIQEEAQRPFDLAVGPVFRFSLLRLQEQEHVLLLTLHHIVSDAWSQGVLTRELSTLYNAFCTGAVSPLPALPIQYADYAAWQREWLQADQLQRQLSYWKQCLEGVPTLLELPTDRPRPPLQTFRGARVRREFSAGLTAGLKALCQREGTTLFMTLLAAFQTLLYRYSNQEQVVVGTPIANRTHSEVEGLIGFFVNTLVLRADLSGDPSFVALLGRVRESTLGAYAHQDLPFEKLVEELQPQRSLSHSAVFQVLFSLANAAGGVLGLAGLEIERVGSEGVSAKFDLSLVLSEGRGKLGGVLVYNTDLFDADRMERMLGHWEVLLEGIVADPQQKVSRLPLLTEPEREQLVVGWNDTAVEYPGERCIHELFEEQVQRTPDAVAVVFHDQQLTYRQLNARANQLAHFLQSLGIGPDALVGLCVERSIEMVVGLLGILKAGGAYLPLDPTYPAERLSFLLKDARVPVLLTQDGLLNTLPAHAAQVVCLDSEWERIAQPSAQRLTTCVTPANLAYVLHTSGSTGVPKGVQIPHSAVVNFLCAMAVNLGMTAADTLLAVTTLSFDIAGLELYLPLMVGARMVVARREEAMDGERLAHRLKASGATVMQATPATWRLLYASGWKGSRGLKALCGAESLPSDLAGALVADCGAVWNLYGPTETTIWSSSERLTEWEGPITIGRPIANTQIYVLDANLSAVPVGVAGELYIGGEGMARGYLNRADLTAERFVADPFGRVPGARMYWTGDLARYLANGKIECLGRLDHQVKVRGFRIELGEIERVLVQHPAVRDAVVVAREDVPGDRRLVAYVVGEDAALSVSDLRKHLRDVLPEYMVPAAFVVLEALPLSANGKVDRKTLPAPEGATAATAEAYVGLRTPVEEGIAEIWREVLRLEQVGVHTSFFELGGHSLLGTQVISRIRNTFAVELPLRALFEAPTIAGLAQRIGASGGEAGYGAPALVRVSREGRLPLSFAQRRLWFIDQLEPQSSLYNVPMALRLTGSLDVGALKQSLQEIVRRHEVLRTTFTLEGGVPSQVIGEAEVLLEVIDLSYLAGEEREAQARRRITEEAQRPFDLCAGPVFRFGVLRLQEEEHVLLLTLHHIVSDAWSQGVLTRELQILYNALHAGQPSQLSELAFQYADYAVWQHNWLQGEVLERQMSYWKHHLAGAPTLLDLPTDRPRPPLQTFRGARVRREFSAGLTAGLKALCQREGTTLFMTLLAAFQTLLYRYSGQDDLVVGTPIANRTHSEVEGLIGFFVNTLVLRADLSGDPSFVALLGRVRESTLGAYAHQDLPFEKLVEELQPQRSLSHSAVFQVLFSLANAAGGVLGLAGLEIERVGSEGVSAKFDLSLVLSEGRGKLMGVLVYNTDLFDADRMERMLGHLQVLLEGIVADPQQKVSRLPLLTEPELEQLAAWNVTAAEYPVHLGLHQLIEEQVQRSPEAVAVVFEDRHLTYRQLNARANQLAHYLQQLAVGPEVLVGLCVHRGFEMVVGLLGILKAGGAYLPLDPNNPAQRLGLVLSDSQPALVLTQQALAESLREWEGKCLCLDSEWDAVCEESDANPRWEGSAQNLAYVIYTSGSTGKPKGVQVLQSGVINYLCWATRAYAVSEGQGAPVHSAISFDLTVTSLFTPLLVGRTVWLLGEEPGSEALRTALSEEKEFSLVKLTPAHLRLLGHQVSVAAAERASRRLVIGGEALQGDHLGLWRAHAPQTRIFNEYGPTETVVGCCVYEIAAGDCPEGALPIGRPIANTQLYVLDRHLQRVASRVSGELYIGGAGVCRGYLKRADLTAEKFIPDPFSDEPGARLYRTGDLASYLPDGNIEFVGRCDEQVKMRGFRIELGEIETVLSEHPGIREAVVVAREEAVGEKRLVGYVVGHAGSVSVSELRAYLGEKLPEYMIPSAWVVMERLPLTANGKVDRKALPAPGSAGQDEGDVGARTPVEEGLAEIWREVLQLEQVGVHTSFFELGGHSLLGTQVISRIRNTFAVELPLRALFEAPTIAGLAQRIGASGGEAGYGAPALVRVSREGRLPLSFAQQRLWFIDQLEPQSSLYNIPMALRLRGPLNEPALESSLNELLRRHEPLRTVFAVSDAEPFQVIEEFIARTLRVTDLSSLEAQERAQEARRLIQEEAQRPFDLCAGPVFRFSLLRLQEEEHVLLLTLHHIVSDAWSRGVLTRELSTLYNAFCTGAVSPLPALPIQYADYAAWQREWLQADQLQRQLSYWKQCLEGVPTLLELPTNRPRPPLQTFRGARVRREFSAGLTAGLKALCQREGTTLFMTLLAAFQTLLYRYSGQDDLVVGTPIANRTHSEVEGLIGFFVNTLVLRADLSGDPSFVALLGRVRESTLGAYAHQDLPFEKLVEELQPQRSLSHSAVFQVLFSLANAAGGVLGLAGLEIERVGSEGVSAKFDLSLVLSERRGKLGGVLEYNTDLFDADRMERMLGHLQVLLEGIVADPQQRVSRLPLLTEPEREQLVVEWNDTAVEYPRDRCIHELFEEQVPRTAEAVAVVFGDQHLTYAELNRRANQLAHYLQKRGVGPEVLVGLCVERSIEMVVGLLGILKAGGAYLPLDPSYPSERLAFMLEDARTPVLLSQRTLEKRLPHTHASVIFLDDIGSLLNRGAADNPVSVGASDHLAYVIYTSGSTGKPKGAMITHRGLINYLCWCTREYRVKEGCGAPVYSSIGFDLTVTGLYSPLLVGRQVVLVPQESGPEALGEALLAGDNYSLVKITPAHLELLSHTLPASHAAGHTRAFIIGGEALRGESLSHWREYAPQTRIVNEYGPTETVVGCCVYSTTAGACAAGAMPIGRPIANTRLYVLDGRGQPVPVGVAGELYIGGEGVGRGYLQRPELTAERFVPDAFGGTPGTRLYRTGDLVRYLSDGNMEYLGRLDYQVKIRGFRIELGEIESVLLGHSAVRDAVVVARDDVAGEKRLVAYVASEVAPSVSELREHLLAKLPQYMVPSAFVMLESLPLSPNGKVVRKALPPPESPGRDKGYIDARTPIEEALAQIWREVLRLKQVGVHTSFFELGGHSLLATQVISRIRNTFAVELPLRSLFEAPTVAGLAERIGASGGEAGCAAPALVRVSREGRLPLSFAQQRLWFIDQLEPGSRLYTVTFACRLTGLLDVIALEQSLHEIVRRHEVLRTTFMLEEGAPVQVIHMPSTVGLQVVDLNSLAAEEREPEARRLIQEVTQCAFDLERGPLFRSLLLRLREQEHILLLTLHHIVSDGWSIGVLRRELAALYNAFQAGKPSPLSQLPIQYADYAVWQREWVGGKVSQEQISYWRTQLRGAAFGLPMRTDHPESAAPTFQGATHQFSCAAGIANSLKDLARSEHASLYMVLLAAFNALLYQDSRQEDICIGTPVSGRRWTETEGLIGLFLNTLVVRTNLSGNPSFRGLVGRVRDTVLAAHAHQDVPFEQVVDALKPQRDLSHTPLFRIWFVVNESSSGVEEFEGLSIRGVATGMAPARYGLRMGISDVADGLRGSLIYQTDLFEAETIQRLIRKMEVLLSSVASDADLPLGQIAERLTEVDRQSREEKRQRLYEENQRRLGRLRRTDVQE